MIRTIRRTLIVAGLILSFVILSYGQNTKKADARMVREPFAGGDALHAIQEVALDLKAQATGIGDRVAVRVCSKEKMPVALLTATASPFLLRDQLQDYGFQTRLILFLRSEDCLAQDTSIAVTEFWVVPSGAEPPTSVESIRADQADVQVVKTADTIKTAQDYSAALRDLIRRTSNRADVVAVVLGSYYKQPGAPLQKNLQMAKRLLELGDVQASRIFTHAAPFSGVSDGEQREPAYPGLFVFSTGVDAVMEASELGVDAEVPGRSLKWIRIAEPHFAQKGFKLERYTIVVFEDDEHVAVILRSFDANPMSRGSSGTYPGYEVEISKKTMKITNGHYVR